MKFIYLFVFHKGAVNISYQTVRGSLQDLRQTDGALAEPGQDFSYISSSVIMQDGQASVSIPIIIIDVCVAIAFLSAFLFH